MRVNIRIVLTTIACLAVGIFLTGCGATFRGNELPDLVESEQPRFRWGDVLLPNLVRTSDPGDLSDEREALRRLVPDIDVEKAAVSTYLYSSADGDEYLVYLSVRRTAPNTFENISSVASFITLGLLPGYYKDRLFYSFFVTRSGELVKKYSYHDELIHRVGVWGFFFPAGENFYVLGDRARPTKSDVSRANVFLHFLQDVTGDEYTFKLDLSNSPLLPTARDSILEE